MGLALVVASCAASGSPELVVSAASSLVEPLRLIETDFEAVNDVDVVLNVGGSSTLRHQILEGAPVDVFISASEEIMTDLVGAGSVGGEVIDIGSNMLQVVAPKDNPMGLSELFDLETVQLSIGACHPTVPCGALTDQALAFHELSIEFATREPDVASVLAKVASGDLDAGFVYVTDDDPGVVTIDVFDEASLRTVYQVAVVDETAHSELAAQFVDYLVSPAGQRRLSQAGFAAP